MAISSQVPLGTIAHTPLVAFTHSHPSNLRLEHAQSHLYLGTPNGSTIKHNMKMHQYKWTRRQGPIHCCKRREKIHHKQMEENKNIKENHVKMYPNKQIRGCLVMTLHFVGGLGN